MPVQKKLLFFFTPLLILSGILFFLSTNIEVYAQAADITPPVTTMTQTPSAPNGKNGWYVTPVQFNFNATDLESGVKEIKYRLNDGVWQSSSYSNTQNLSLNPSFEITGATTTGAAYWEASVVDPEATYTVDNASAPAFPNSSLLISATGGTWHGINNKDNFAATAPYDNMTASVWLKTQGATGGASFKIYAISPNGLGGYTYTPIGQSTTILGTNGWNKVSYSFTVTASDAVGVYIDIGLAGPGQLWVDAVNINSSLTSTQTNYTVAADSILHTLEYYAVDNADNIEFSSCTAPITNCVTFKLDQTPPSNWRNAGAFRSRLADASTHHLFVHVTVDDLISGLSAFTNIYQYQTDKYPTSFGSFLDLMSCDSSWRPSISVNLEQGVLTDGTGTATLQTQLTNFCNNDWKTCKTVRFYSEDMAGNTLTKEFCINGPWIRLRGGGVVRANRYIDMIAEPQGFNTDSLIEARENLVEFFTSSKNWIVRSSPVPPRNEYDNFSRMVSNQSSMSNTTSLPTVTGAYLINGDYEASSTKRPSALSTATFDTIIFVDGNLRITADLDISNSSTMLFVVKGKVEVAKTVELIDAAILANGTFYTAYNAGPTESTDTLVLRGLYSAQKFELQRTLQGTNNETIPSEDFIYEPKYIIHMKRFMNNSSVTWL